MASCLRILTRAICTENDLHPRGAEQPRNDALTGSLVLPAADRDDARSHAIKREPSPISWDCGRSWKGNWSFGLPLKRSRAAPPETAAKKVAGAELELLIDAAALPAMVAECFGSVETDDSNRECEVTTLQSDHSRPPPPGR
jgi:hypothetical protein